MSHEVKTSTLIAAALAALVFSSPAIAGDVSLSETQINEANGWGVMAGVVEYGAKFCDYKVSRETILSFQLLGAEQIGLDSADRIIDGKYDNMAQIKEIAYQDRASFCDFAWNIVMKYDLL